MRKFIAVALVAACLTACSQHDRKSDRQERREPRAERGDGGGRGGRFERLDTDHDGFIEKSEAPERMQRRFDRLDTNGDGKLSEDELAAGRRSR